MNEQYEMEIFSPFISFCDTALLKTKTTASIVQSIMYQIIHKKMTSNPRKGLVSKITYKFLKKAYEFIAATKNPLVNFQCGERTLKLPFSHDLPFILNAYPRYASNLGRIAKYVQERYKDLTFIDIGANIGDSVFILKAKAEFPVLCIEGDDYFFNILQDNVSQFSNVFSEKAYVGQETQEMKKEALRENGTAYLVSSTKNIPVKSLSSLLQEYPSFSLSKMLKIDTDGFDGFIIRGAIDFLKIAKPIIFFEYDPYLLSQQSDDGLSIFKSLREIGYRAIIIYDNFGEYMFSLNLEQTQILEEIHCYLLGRNNLFYADICAFHIEDFDLFEKIRALELDFSEKLNISKISI